MIKFFKILFQKLFKKKDKDKLKGLGEYLMTRKSVGTLPEDIEIENAGKGIFKIKTSSDLSFEEIVDIIEGYIEKEGE